jgi:hypothetical protein
MAKFVIALIVVVALVSGGLVALLRARRLRLPPPDVMDRVRRREQELQAKEKLERDA